MLLKAVLFLEGVEIPTFVFVALAAIWVAAFLYWVVQNAVGAGKRFRSRRPDADPASGAGVTLTVQEQSGD